MTVPSVSHSLTVRLEVAARGNAVSELTHAVEHAGGAVTALDVTASLDAQSAAISTELLLAAGRALAAVVGDEELNPHYIVPSVFHPDVASKVAAAVRAAAVTETDG